MTLHELLSDELLHSYVVSLQYNNNSLLFSSHLLALLKKKHTVQSLLVADNDIATITALLSSSFLGMKMVYWVNNVDQLDDKKQEALRVLLRSYKGPHTILCLMPAKWLEREDANAQTIVLHDITTVSDYHAYFSLLYPDIAYHGGLITKVFAVLKSLTLDQAVLLMHYQLVMGNSYEHFLQEWLPDIIAPERSLFNLSSFLFAKKASQFFSLWSLIEPHYPLVFWTTFWSEQFFRAYNFIEYMHQKKIAEAKKVAYRLPFSFIQKDWKMLDRTVLSNAHQVLYEIEYKIKNGLSCSNALEIMFCELMQ